MGETDIAAPRRPRRATVVLASALCFAAVVAPAARAADFVVNSTADAPDAKPGDHLCITVAATCTLRAAVQEADADGGANTIFIPRGYYRLSIPPATEAGAAGQDDAGTGDLDMTASLTIRGAGARQTIIDGGGLDRVFSNASTATSSISDLTITRGDSTGGGTSKEIDMGGAIFNQGTLSLERLRLVGNHADGGGAVFSIPGSYITIRDSLLTHNTAYEAGAVRFDSGGEVVNSTITANALLPLPNESYAQQPKLLVTLADELSGYGGGVDHRGGSDLTFINSTITDNHAVKGGGGLNSGQAYAAVSDQTAIARVRLLNTIIAGNTSTKGPGDCNVQDMIIQSAGHNLDSDGSCFLTATGDLPKHNPLLGPLAFNGGPTETQALLPGSPAIDAGATDGCPQFDQRGVARPQGRACDVGAYERVPPTTRSTTRRHRRTRHGHSGRRRSPERHRHRLR
ncbi:MAG TPA: choice-of-anchor Q domain-containing protein [Solirubrobacteraceae bacterium]|nr:choice-of-anchor Q domain-containing protein [Solirubrobacteraceae bacterium]